MAGIKNEVLYGINVDFSGSVLPSAQVLLDGQMLIGSSVSPNIRVSTPSNGNNITWTFGNGTAQVDITGTTNHSVQVGNSTGSLSSLSVGSTNTVLLGNSGANPTFGAVPNAALSNSSITLSNGTNISITGSPVSLGGAATINVSGPASATTLTSHGVLIGAGTSAITATAAGSVNQVLQSGGASADPVWSTATYPATTTANQILYSSATNTISQITAANSASLVTSSAGVPSLATMTSGQLIIGNTGGTPTAALPTSTGGNFIAGAGSLKYIPANYSAGCSNLSIAYSGGTFTVQSADGTALSATNPGYVTLQSKGTPGKLVTITVTANQTFTDGSAGTTDNQRFGLVTGVNWAQDIPFFLYGVMDDTEALINFMISRNPAATVSPASASIGKTGAVVNVGQGDFFSLGNITVTSYDSNPCINLGSFRMQFAGATDSFTVQTLTTTDGIGQFNEQTSFTMPTGVNGAAGGTYFNDVATAEPTFTTNTYIYSIYRSGMVDLFANFVTVNNVPSGAGASALCLPYASSSASGNAGYIGYYRINSTTVQYAITAAINAGTALLSGIGLAGLTLIFTNATYGASDSMAWRFAYKAY